MKIFWVARVARFDLLRAVSFLACHLTKWDTECDPRLYRLVCYLHSSREHRMSGWVGDPATLCSLHLYSDADFAGCQRSNRSTTGVCLAIEGPHTCLPLSAVSKKQSAVSHSTPEAEIVAGAYALRHEGLPGQIFWAVILRMHGGGVWRTP